jgi:hypothetical protein
VTGSVVEQDDVDLLEILPVADDVDLDDVAVDDAERDGTPDAATPVGASRVVWIASAREPSWSTPVSTWGTFAPSPPQRRRLVERLSAHRGQLGFVPECERP